MVQSTEDLVPIRLQGDSMREFEVEVGYSISEIELDSNGNGNTGGSKHGVFQLRFAMPVLLKNPYEHTLNTNSQKVGI
jgi:hypothetical protein